MKSPFMKLIVMGTWFITAVASVLVGVLAIGTNIYAWPILDNPKTVMILSYVVGVAGIISLIMMVLHHGCNCCSQGCNKTNDCNCGCSTCKCGGRRI